MYKELTELENKVLEAIKDDPFYKESEGQGLCWCFTEQFAKDAGISVESCKGVLGSLVKKEVIHIDNNKDCGDSNNALTVSEKYR